MSANPDFVPDSSLHWSEMALDSALSRKRKVGIDSLNFLFPICYNLRTGLAEEDYKEETLEKSEEKNHKIVSKSFLTD